ncbi:hypothetical protein BpHYR1_045982 [Brachionus plicatilis]|uniref:Uncharacterized protein n=1 Tax=Brachionus plicatilis TaxID=10195 RepID=A0A3M7T7B3_BRAPC|nr:hypothetical protein BpHYR1_045982 [Brachionus plicatilis]
MFTEFTPILIPTILPQSSFRFCMLDFTQLLPLIFLPLRSLLCIPQKVQKVQKGPGPDKIIRKKSFRLFLT